MQKAADLAAGRPQALTQEEVRTLEAVGVQQLLASAGQAALLEQQSLARHERLRAWASLSCEERTQRISFERWPPGPGTQCYQVSMPSPKEKPHLPLHQPTIRIHAHSPYEAEALYRDLCGIIQSDWPISVIPAPPEAAPEGPPPAPAADAPATEVDAARQPGGKETSAAAEGGGKGSVRKLS
jgi:hypothetical protein